MTEEEISELLQYFRLVKYQEDGELLLEEYYELENIINNNIHAKRIDKARCLNILGKLSDSEYENLLNYYNNIIEERRGLSK